MRRNSLFRLLAMTSAMVIGLMSATRAFAEGSVYIKANLTDVKIGDLYYDLNTKTHKAAVVYQHHPVGELSNYGGMASIVIPSTVKFALPLQEEITYDVVEIGDYAFGKADDTYSLSIPSSIVYIGRNPIFFSKSYYEDRNPDKWYDDGFYVDNCLLDTKRNDSGSKAPYHRTNFTVKKGTRVIADYIINADNVTFLEGKVRLSSKPFYADFPNPHDKDYLKTITLLGAEIDGSIRSDNEVTIYNYSGEIDYSTDTYNSLKKMYVTRDVARYHTTGRNVQWKDKVELFRFKVGDLYYELLNKDEAVVAYDASYASLSKEIVIPDKVTNNGHTFPVTKIDNEAFKGAAFTKVTLPSTITTVSESAFSGCTKLTDVAFADEVTTIGKQAFVGCTALKELDLNKVANISAEAFKGCTSLATLTTSYAGVVNAHGMAFDGLNKGNITLQVASNMVSRYKEDAVWKDFKIAANRYKLEGIWYELSGSEAMVVKEKNGEGNYSELTGKVTIPKDVVINGKYYTVTSLEVGAFQYAPFEELDIRCQVTILPEGCCFAMPNLTNLSFNLICND